MNEFAEITWDDLIRINKYLKRQRVDDDAKPKSIVINASMENSKWFGEWFEQGGECKP